MKNITLRIIGALAAALIVVAVFVPFYTSGSSLWDMHNQTQSLYLPIMIMAFGALGIIFFSLNIKTEFAYMSSGAIIFFLIAHTVESLSNNTFENLNAGYYFLIVGSVLMSLIAFLTNLKPKANKNTIEVVDDSNNKSDVIQQIDRLYDGQTQPNELQQIQPIQNQEINQNIQPIAPINSVEEISPVPVEQPREVEAIIPEPTIDASIVMEKGESELGNINNLERTIPEPTVQSAITTQQLNQPIADTPNPVVSEFETPVSVPNPVVSEFETPVSVPNPVVSKFETPVSVPNPVVNEFETPISVPNPVVSEFETPVSVQNPVVSEFETPVSVQNPVVSEVETPNGSNKFMGLGQPVQSVPTPTYNTNTFESNATPEVDIFGQPVIK